MLKYSKKKIFEIASVLNGYAFKSKNYTTSGIRIIRIANVQDGFIVDDSPCFYPIDESEDIKSYFLYENDLLISLTGNVGRVGILNKSLLPAALNQRVACIRPDLTVINVKFLFYYLQQNSFQNSCIQASRGMAQLNLSSKWLAEYELPVPPLPEQERIVAKIEELFSQLDAAVAELKSVKEKLAIYRQAVLKEAFDKYATEDKELKCFIDSPRYRTSKKCDYYTDEQYIPVYRIPNIDYSTGRVSHEDIKKANFAKEELVKLQLEIGDILLIRSNGSLNLVGRAALITEQDVHGVFAGYLIRIRIKDKIALVPQYLLYALSSSKARSYIERTAKSTSGVNNINSEEISKLKIPYCSPERQQLVLNQIETILPFCDTIEQNVDTALQRAAAFRQSILKQAFEGKL